MKKSFCWIVVLLCGIMQNVYPDMDFFGYQEHHPNDSTVEYVKQWIGGVQLENVELTIVSAGAYLDITEDAWISGNIARSNLPGMTDHFYFKGDIPVPSEAAVTGIQTWIGNTMYRARLKPAEYKIDDTYSSEVDLQKELSQRVILLRQLSETRHELTLSHAPLGETRHVRIRYLLPNETGGVSQYRVPVLFHSREGTPRFVKVHITADSLIHRYKVQTGAGLIALSDTTTNILPYTSLLPISHDRTDHATLHSTRIPDGDWQGNYLKVNTSIPDSLIMKLSRNIETIFIWKWHTTSNMIAYSGGIRTVSSQGREVVYQASDIKNKMETLTRRGHPVGLVHLIPGEKMRLFSPASARSEEYKKILAYLDTFTENYLYDTFRTVEEKIPDWVPQEVDSGKVEEGGQLFLSALQTAQELFSTNKNQYKHLVVKTIPHQPYVRNTLRRAVVDSILGNTTIDVSTATWRGVYFLSACPDIAEQNLINRDGGYFPSFEPETIHLQVFNGQTPYAFPLPANLSEGFTANAKAPAVWDSVIHWVGFDGEGRKTAAIKTQPLVYESDFDTGLVKIWATDESRIWYLDEPYIGSKYGILTKSTYFQASVEDVSPNLARGVPYLSPDEIEYPIATIRRDISQVKVFKPIVRMRGRRLFFRLPSHLKDAVVYIYNLQGRLITSINLESYRVDATTFLVPLNALDRSLSHACFVVSIRASEYSATVKVISGGTK